MSLLTGRFPHGSSWMMFFIGVNIALLGLLVYGLMTAKEKIKAGRDR